MRAISPSSLQLVANDTLSPSSIQEYLSSIQSLQIIGPNPGPHENGVEEVAIESDLEARATGSFLASLCGNVLAAPLVSDRSYQVPRRYPDGVTSFQARDLGEEPMRYGQYDGSWSLLLATGKSVVAEGKVSSAAMAREMARLEPESSSRTRRYPPYGRFIIDTLNGPPLQFAEIPILAALHLAKTAKSSSQIAGDRPEFDYRGPDDNSGVARVLPVAWAYLNSPQGEVDEAIKDALIFSHTESAIDSARVFSAAISWLSRQIPPLTDGSESSREDVNAAAMGLSQGLISHLSSVALTDEMRMKLVLINGGLFQLTRVENWRRAYSSQEWSRLILLQNSLSHKGIASYGVEAVAVALLALCANIASGPTQAVILSASFAGSSSSVVSQLTGAFAGALFGYQWIPTEWTDNLEMQARDEAIQMAKDLNRARIQLNSQEQLN